MLSEHFVKLVVSYCACIETGSAVGRHLILTSYKEFHLLEAPQDFRPRPVPN